GFIKQGPTVLCLEKKIQGSLCRLGTGVFLAQRNKVVSEKQFSKTYLKYLTEKYLKINNLDDWLGVVASDKEIYELRYFQISQNEEGCEFEDYMGNQKICVTCFIVIFPLLW
uniref:Uncharacterized protein n=1 Tax=Monodelphis domestica TaxID=13616 RepID=A0A5F8GG38_MONDO